MEHQNSRSELKNQPEDKSKFIAKKKWTPTVIDAGFLIVPDVLVRSQAYLGLSPVDVVVLLNVGMHWWQEDNLPYPRPSVIANRMGISTRTVERRLANLQENGFLKRREAEVLTTKGKKKTVRRFDLSGLIQKLAPLAERNLQLRKGRVDNFNQKLMEESLAK